MTEFVNLGTKADSHYWFNTNALNVAQGGRISGKLYRIDTGCWIKANHYEDAKVCHHLFPRHESSPHETEEIRKELAASVTRVLMSRDIGVTTIPVQKIKIAIRIVINVMTRN